MTVFVYTREYLLVKSQLYVANYSSREEVDVTSLQYIDVVFD